MTSSNFPVRNSLSRNKSAAIKGILIMLVVLGHNHFFVEVFSMSVFSWLYSFHVAIFFVLPFFYPSKRFSWARMRTNAKRLLWPYSYMFLLFALINIFIFKSSSLNLSVFHTYITGDFYTLKTVVGFQYIWFLPAMFSMLFIKDIYDSVANNIRAIILIIGLVFFFISWVFMFHQPYSKVINTTLSSYSILSVMLGWGTFFMGVITKWIASNWRWSMITPLMIMLLTFISMVLSSGAEIYEWISRCIAPIACMILFLNAEFKRCVFFERIGELSLQIYLIHQPVNFIICKVVKSFSISPFTGLIVSFMIVLVLSYFLSQLISRIPVLRKLLFAK